jgi:oligosaccharyltransferase complex subunit beta
MRWCLTLLAFCFLAVVHALSSSGSRLLVVLEDAAEKELYSKLWADLEARGYNLDFESPKNDKLSLFELGDRVYDHLLLLPPKSKG